MEKDDTMDFSVSLSADPEMTVLSKEMFECAMSIHSVKDALNILMSYRQFRTLKDILNAFANGADLRTALVDGLMSWQPTAVRENVDRKVRNWLNGSTTSIRKQDAFVLSRILKLSLEQTNEFLKMISGEGIHWRNPEDIAWCYAIVRDMEPAQILELLDRVEAIGTMKKAKPDIPSDHFTQEVHDRLQSVLSEDTDTLIAVLESEWGRLGKFHNTSYQLFTQYMDLLKDGYLESDRSYLYDEKKDDLRTLKNENKEKRAKDQAERLETARKEAKERGEVFLPDQPEYRLTLEYAAGTPELIVPEADSDQSILEEYLYRKLVPTRNQDEQNPVREALQRAIRQNWPDTASLSRMRKRQIDIPRKLLILLFLATDGSNSDFSDELLDEQWDEELSKDETFLDIYTRLNLMLNSCGFQKLDPRSAFDWMILYCISTGDLWESDERIRAMLTEMFPRES